MKNILFTLSVCFLFFSFQEGSAQTSKLDSLRKKRDNSLRAIIHKDSVKLNQEFAKNERWIKLDAQLFYPLLKGGKYSGVVPVTSPNEIPDPNLDYKILFELRYNNPDSTIQEINEGLNEIARIINLHVASGIVVKKIFPVILVHGGALNSLKSNEAFQKKYKVNNPNLRLIHDMVKIGAQFIACGQSMAVHGILREELIPEVKISLTAQTVLTSYQLKGYVLRQIVVE